MQVKASPLHNTSFLSHFHPLSLGMFIILMWACPEHFYLLVVCLKPSLHNTVRVLQVKKKEVL